MTLNTEEFGLILFMNLMYEMPFKNESKNKWNKIESNLSKNVRNNKGRHLVVKNQKLCSVARERLNETKVFNAISCGMDRNIT